MVREGILDPASSAEFIANNAKHVKIHAEGLEKLTKEVIQSMKEGKLSIPDTGTDIIHPSKDHPRAADWVFVTDTLNFYFWSRPGQDSWTVNGHTGYYALEAALHRAIKEGIDIANPEYYSKITSVQLKHIMRGDKEDIQIPLFEKRLEVLHEVGQILIEKFNGTFETCLREANKSAVKLLKIVVDNFPCFRDESVYNGVKVSFYKRAQILVADVWNFFGETGWGEFSDIDRMTMFADYRVPQVLVYFGVLSYSDGLMEKLRNQIQLPSGSDEEIEIRGCSIHAVELLTKRVREELAKTTVEMLQKTNEEKPQKTNEEMLQKTNVEKLQVPNSSLIDYYLWCYRRKYRKELDTVPFHMTEGIFY